MENKGLAEVYTYHHRAHKRLGRSVFSDIRGNFLRTHIGTGKEVLDIGCRDGVLTSTYSEGNHVLGLDIDQGALDAAKEKLGIDVRQTDLNSDWAVPDNHFDVVVAGEVMEHLYYPEKVTGKIARALKPEGVLLGSVPNAFSLANRLRFLFGKKLGTPLGDPTHINQFYRKELKKILEKYFKDVEIIPLGRFTWLDRIFPGLFCFMFLFRAQDKKAL